MSTMNISLPEALKAFVDDKVAGGAYATSSEYVRELIRRELDREKFREFVLAGGASPPVGEPDFDRLRERVRSRAQR